MRNQHKHAALIKAWADGAEIQVFTRLVNDLVFAQAVDDWVSAPTPSWDTDKQYRIRPEPKPDIVDLVRAHRQNTPYMFEPTDVCPANLKLIWDGETRKLKSAEVIA